MPRALFRTSAEAALVALVCGACAPETHSPAVGSATGSATCDIFRIAMTPPDVGDGVAVVVLGGSTKTLAQASAAFAVDSSGQQVVDPAQAAYFAIQIYQYVTPTRIELFEARVEPQVWKKDADVIVDGTLAVAFTGTIELDDNGNVGAASIVASSTGGTIHVDSAGENLGEPVAISFSIALSS